MAKRAPGVLYKPKPADKPQLDPLDVFLSEPKPQASITNGVSEQELEDGSKVIDFSPSSRKDGPASDKFYANLAEQMDEAELGVIASDMIQGIQRDKDSVREWMEGYTSGLMLLGLQIEDQHADAGMSTAPLEGMSRVRHPLMNEACLTLQAIAKGEMLPAAGPVKVRDDQAARFKPLGVAPLPSTPMPPIGGQPAGNGVPFPPSPAGPYLPPGMPSAPAAPNVQPGMPPAAGLPQGAPLNGMGGMALLPEQTQEARDNLADALEQDFNHYLTVTAKEYYPDTDQMFYNTAFCGIGIKKVYNCPLRRRPVSETVAIEDFIVSNALSSLSNSGRYTHRIKMRPSVLKRMQIIGAYRDVPLQEPTVSGDADQVEEAKAQIQGINPNNLDPRDSDYTLYEVYCELDLDKFAPRQFKGKGLPLPYIVTIEEDSEKVLQVRRNWKEKDEECQAREFFVDYVFDRAFGFYGIGYLHILGNTTKALTAAWREFLDMGMFNNFPGFLYAKGLSRQLTNQFRVPPGGGVGLDVGLQPIKDAVMPLPYKDLGAGFTAFIQHMEDIGERLAGTANISVGEGKQDAPVGTTMALIEQASKTTGAVMKRFHGAQARELQLLKERFREDPEAFWRFNDKPAMPWEREQFLSALNDFDLVPVSDPSNPTRLHRAAKGAVVQQLAMAAPDAFDIPKTISYIGRQNEISEIEDLLAQPQAQQAPPIDPIKQAEIQVKQQKVQSDQQTAMARIQSDQQSDQLKAQATAAELQTRKEIAIVHAQIERMKLATALATHGDKMDAQEKSQALTLLYQRENQLIDQLHQEQAQARDHAVEVGLAQQAQVAAQDAQNPQGGTQ